MPLERAHVQLVVNGLIVVRLLAPAALHHLNHLVGHTTVAANMHNMDTWHASSVHSFQFGAHVFAGGSIQCVVRLQKH